MKYIVYKTVSLVNNKIYIGVHGTYKDEFDGYDRSVDTYIKYLRQKIEPDPKSPQYIVTIYGVGYKFVP